MITSQGFRTCFSPAGEWKYYSNRTFAWAMKNSFLLLLIFFEGGVSFVLATPSNYKDLTNASMVDPVITVRLSNPQFSCATMNYVVDVEFQSNTSGQELFGMNVRFYYDDVVLEWVNFTNFVAGSGYGVAPPNPPIMGYSETLGPAYFNFGGGSDYIGGAIQLNNESAPPVIISTSGWTKIFSITFHVDDPNANVNNFCPSIVWDLKANPANGGFLGGEGVLMTVANPNGGSLPSSEQVVQYNWVYTGNGNTPPFGQPSQITCSSIACGPCDLLVSSTADAGAGTLRAAIACALTNDTITFSPALANLTITLTTSRLLIDKNLFIRSNITPRIKITSTVPGLFEIAAGKAVEFKDLDLTSGTSVTSNGGAAFNNFGLLKLIGVKVLKNANLPTGQYLVRNKPSSTLTTIGNCFIQLN